MAISLAPQSSFSLTHSSSPSSSPAPPRMAELLGIQELQQQLQAQAEQLKMLQDALESVQRNVLEQKRGPDRIVGRVESLVTRVGTLETRCGTHEARTLQLESDKDRSEADATSREVKLQLQRLEARVVQLETQEQQRIDLAKKRQLAVARLKNEASPETSGRSQQLPTSMSAPGPPSERSGFQTPESQAPRGPIEPTSSPSEFATPLSKVPGVPESTSSLAMTSIATQPKPYTYSGFSLWSGKDSSRTALAAHGSSIGAASSSPSSNAFTALGARGTSIFGTPCTPTRAIPSTETVPRFFTPTAASATSIFGTTAAASSHPSTSAVEPSAKQAHAPEALMAAPSSDDSARTLETAMAALPALTASKETQMSATQKPSIAKESAPAPPPTPNVNKGQAKKSRRTASTQSVQAAPVSAASQPSQPIPAMGPQLTREQSLTRLKELVVASRARELASFTDVSMEDDDSTSTTATVGCNSPARCASVALPSQTLASKPVKKDAQAQASGEKQSGVNKVIEPSKKVVAPKEPTPSATQTVIQAPLAPIAATAAAPPTDIPSDKTCDAPPQTNGKAAEKAPVPEGTDDGFSIVSVNVKPTKKTSLKTPVSKVKVKTEKDSQPTPLAPPETEASRDLIPAAAKAVCPASTAPASTASAPPATVPAATASSASAGPTLAPPPAAPASADASTRSPRTRSQTIASAAQTKVSSTVAQPTPRAPVEPPAEDTPQASKPAMKPAAKALPTQPASSASKPSEPVPQPPASPHPQPQPVRNGTPKGPAKKSDTATAPVTTSRRGFVREPHAHCAETALGPAGAGALMEYAGFSEALGRENPQFAIVMLNGRRLVALLDVSWVQSSFCASLIPELESLSRAGPKYRTRFCEADGAWSFPLFLYGTSIDNLDALPTRVAAGSEIERPAMALDAIRHLRYDEPCRIDVKISALPEHQMAWYGVSGGIVLGRDFLLQPPWRARLRICRMERYTLHHFYFSTRFDDWAFPCFAKREMAYKFGFRSRGMAGRTAEPPGPSTSTTRRSMTSAAAAAETASSATGDGQRGPPPHLPSKPSPSATASLPNAVVPRDSRPVISVLGQGQRTEDAEMTIAVAAPSSPILETVPDPQAIPTGPALGTPTAPSSHTRSIDSGGGGSSTKSLAERLQTEPRHRTAHPSTPISASATSAPKAHHPSPRRSPSSSSFPNLNANPNAGGSNKRKLGVNGGGGGNVPLGERISGPRSGSKSPGAQQQNDRSHGHVSPGASPSKRLRSS